ncbi:MAG: hypothetical protein KF760_33610 [Candidatus Eremiobacteraeota bacterium]|nr:hypothetical protein [Candidatus Eremiobacteraeota bacterium]MCW5872869.1 hypothetical protein [Candidatus Eremiobacteraeota bacterium]
MARWFLLIFLWLICPAASRALPDEFCGPHACPRHPDQLCQCAHHDLCGNRPHSPMCAPPRLEALCPTTYRLAPRLRVTRQTHDFLVFQPGEAPQQAPEPPPPRLRRKA